MSEAAGKKIGPFELISEIPGESSGGQGTVYIAHYVTDAPEFESLRPGDQVALKHMPITRDKDDRMLTRLQKRVAVLKQFDHPGIVRYYGCFSEKVWPHCDYFVAMEYLSGTTIKQRIFDSLAGLDAPEAYDICCQCLDALCYAKKNGIVHRDITPSNIFRCTDGTVKLIDFEVAKNQLNSEETTLTGLVGKTPYMAPELFFEGKKNWEKADVFSLALCFHEIFTKELPYTHGNTSRTQGKVIINENIPGLIYGLESVLARALNLDINERYHTLEAFASDFKALKVTEWKGTVDTYQALQFIGAGGYGKVLKARRKSNNNEVAIKWLIHLSSAERERFRREAEILRKFDDDRIVNFVDYFEEDKSLHHYAFLVMNYLPGMPGSSLRDRLKAAKGHNERHKSCGLPSEEVFTAFLRLAEGLQLMHKHEEKIFHRDLKPANLYMPEGEPGRACIMDLGVARNLNFKTITQQHPPGTPDYMSPELARDERGSAASDIYALGLSLHEALTGSLPIPRLSKKGDKNVWASYLIRSQNPPIPEFRDPIILANKTLLSLLEGMTNPDPQQRMSDIGEVVRILRHLVPGYDDATSEETEMTSAGRRSSAPGGAEDEVTALGDKTGTTRPPIKETIIVDPHPPKQKPVALHPAPRKPKLAIPPPKKTISGKKPPGKSLRWLASILLFVIVLAAGELGIRYWPRISADIPKVRVALKTKMELLVLTRVKFPLVCYRIESLKKRGMAVVSPEHVPKFETQLETVRVAVWATGDLLAARQLEESLKWKGKSFSEWTNFLESVVVKLPYKTPVAAFSNALSLYQERKITEGDSSRDQEWAPWKDCLPAEMVKRQNAELESARGKSVIENMRIEDATNTAIRIAAETDMLQLCRSAMLEYKNDKLKEGDAYRLRVEGLLPASSTNRLILSKARMDCLYRVASNIVNGVKMKYEKVDLTGNIPIDAIEKDWKDFVKEFPLEEVKRYGANIAIFRKDCLYRVASNIVNGVQMKYEKVDLAGNIPTEAIEKDWEIFVKDCPLQEVKRYGDDKIVVFRKAATDKKIVWDALEAMVMQGKALINSTNLKELESVCKALLAKIDEAKRCFVVHKNAEELLVSLKGQVEKLKRPVRVSTAGSKNVADVRVNVYDDMGKTWETVTVNTTLAPEKTIRIRFERPDYKSSETNAYIGPIVAHVIHIPEDGWVDSDSVARLKEASKIIQQAHASNAHADWEKARDVLGRGPAIVLELEANRRKWAGLMREIKDYFGNYKREQERREEVKAIVDKFVVLQQQAEKGDISGVLANSVWPRKEVEADPSIKRAASNLVVTIQHLLAKGCEDEPSDSRLRRIKEAKLLSEHPNTQKMVSLTADASMDSSFIMTSNLVEKAWNTFLVGIVNRSSLRITLSLDGKADVELNDKERATMPVRVLKTPQVIKLGALSPGYRPRHYDIHPVPGGITNVVVADFVPSEVAVTIDAGGDLDVRAWLISGADSRVQPFGKVDLAPGRYTVEFKKPGYIKQTTNLVVGIGASLLPVKPGMWSPVWVPVDFVSPRTDDGDHASVSIALSGGADNVRTNISEGTYRLRVGKYSAVYSRNDSEQQKTEFMVGENEPQGKKVMPENVWKPLPAVLTAAEKQSLVYRKGLIKHLLDKACAAFQYDVRSGGKRTKLDIDKPQRPEIKEWVIDAFSEEALKRIVRKDNPQTSDLLADRQEGIERLRQIHQSAQIYLEEPGFRSLYEAVLNPLYELKTSGFPLNKYDVALAEEVYSVTKRWRDARRIPTEIEAMDKVLADMYSKLKAIKEKTSED